MNGLANPRRSLGEFRLVHLVRRGVGARGQGPRSEAAIRRRRPALGEGPKEEERKGREREQRVLVEGGERRARQTDREKSRRRGRKGRGALTSLPSLSASARRSLVRSLPIAGNLPKSPSFGPPSPPLPTHLHSLGSDLREGRSGQHQCPRPQAEPRSWTTTLAPKTSERGL